MHSYLVKLYACELAMRCAYSASEGDVTPEQVSGQVSFIPNFLQRLGTFSLTQAHVFQ